MVCSSNVLVLLVWCICCHVVMSAPSKRAGPCEGLDCLHGVLMHGDEHQGESHSNEDIYNKLQSDDENRGKLSGPDAEVLPDVDDSMPARIEPDATPEQNGPCEGMDCLHGVLMHADDEQGHNHEKDHAKAESVKHLPLANDADPDKAMHDSSDAHIHDETKESDDANKVEIAPNNADPERMVHGAHSEEHIGDKSVEGEKSESVYDKGIDEIANADESIPLTADDESDAPLDTHEHETHNNDGILSNNADPEIAMHGTAHSHWVVEHDKKEATKHDTKQDVNPEAMLHGSDSSHVHSHDDVKGDKPKGVPISSGTIDPHVLIHGDEYIDKVHAEDQDEYLRWQRQGGAEQLGYTIPDFSLGILNKLDEIRQKYVGNIWADDDDDSKEGEDDSEDMRHELEIMGNTAPVKTEH